MPIRLLCAIQIATLSVLFTPATPAQESVETHPFFDKPIQFGCHRGGAKWRPESTVKTFEELVATWPEVMLECDIHMTKDRQIVVIHDGTVNRTTNGSGEIADMTLAEIQALDAGYNWSSDDGATHPFRGKGYRIPTLAEALAVAPDNNWLVEIKDQPGIDVALAIREIEKAGMVDRVLLASFNPALMDAAEAINPSIATCFDSNSRKGLVQALRGDWDAYDPPDDVFTLSYRGIARYGITPDDFPTLRAKGIPICAYVINDPEEIRELLDLGVQSMLTDRPDVFSRVLRQWRKKEDN